MKKKQRRIKKRKGNKMDHTIKQIFVRLLLKKGFDMKVGNTQN